MIKATAITDDATYERVQARLIDMMDKVPKDEFEAAELDALADELERYYRERFAPERPPSDGVHEVVFMLDMGIASLDELLPLVGGRDRLVEFMTRRRNLDSDAIDAIVAKFNRKREELDKPFCEDPGWDVLSTEGQEPCVNPDCCDPDARDWRAELTGIGRIEAGLGVGNPAHPAYPR